MTDPQSIVVGGMARVDRDAFQGRSGWGWVIGTPTDLVPDRWRRGDWEEWLRLAGRSEPALVATADGDRLTIAHVAGGQALVLLGVPRLGLRDAVGLWRSSLWSGLAVGDRVAPDAVTDAVVAPSSCATAWPAAALDVLLEPTFPRVVAVRRGDEQLLESAFRGALKAAPGVLKSIAVGSDAVADFGGAPALQLVTASAAERWRQGGPDRHVIVLDEEGVPSPTSGAEALLAWTAAEGRLRGGASDIIAWSARYWDVGLALPSADERSPLTLILQDDAGLSWVLDHATEPGFWTAERRSEAEQVRAADPVGDIGDRVASAVARRLVVAGDLGGFARTFRSLAPLCAPDRLQTIVEGVIDAPWLAEVDLWELWDVVAEHGVTLTPPLRAALLDTPEQLEARRLDIVAGLVRRDPALLDLSPRSVLWPWQLMKSDQLVVVGPEVIEALARWCRRATLPPREGALSKGLVDKAVDLARHPRLAYELYMKAAESGHPPEEIADGLVRLRFVADRNVALDLMLLPVEPAMAKAPPVVGATPRPRAVGRPTTAPTRGHAAPAQPNPAPSVAAPAIREQDRPVAGPATASPRDTHAGVGLWQAVLDRLPGVGVRHGGDEDRTGDDTAPPVPPARLLLRRSLMAAGVLIILGALVLGAWALAARWGGSSRPPTSTTTSTSTTSTSTSTTSTSSTSTSTTSTSTTSTTTPSPSTVTAPPGGGGGDGGPGGAQ